MNEQVRRNVAPKRVRFTTDRQFASGCSPPRLSTDAVTFSYGAVADPDTDKFHAQRQTLNPYQRYPYRSIIR